ncbi:N-methylhydantoinase B [Desulfosarcina ovata subsp. sediminis]|uniref:N-methylhydantoinase B n=1 Tax=Desulfosarcina ovata subsp. sediminis TaxID=885957 RepID=A0A5K7ZD42_9BACT|nr:hydantoinase B/oxoprolinase family protein [Desulfosarcina ovata]BBO79912.1 N-methylhydantoinase B [Desulfosarcina ovata subsp. sediminis]
MVQSTSDKNIDKKHIIDPFLMSVLKSRFEAIVREMTLVVMKASRSAVIKNAKDLSCAILTYDHRLVTTEDALPIHVSSMNLATTPITKFFSDIKPGDIFANNSPYTGATHHADLILAMPVFFQNEPLFWVVALSHHADTGAPQPSTYLPYAKTIYEEGMHYPCVRIAENYKEKDDIIRMGRLKNRVPDLWHGDVRAQIGACITGEKRTIELCQKYGVQTLRDFVEEWFDYASRRIKAEIQKLPSGEYSYEIKHDPVPGVADDGIPIKLKLLVDSDKGEIIVDVRDNIDCIDGGLNLSKNTCTGSCRIGVYNNLDDSIPHCHGSAKHIKVLMRKGSVVGEPKYPVGTSVATTNVNDRLITAGNSVFSKMGKPYGQAEGGPHLPVGMAVISGHDPFKDGQVYVNQIFVGYAGGGANYGYDGWLTYCGPANGGLITLDSVEIDESMYPFIIESREVRKDSQGFGEFEGAPGVAGVFYPLNHDLTVMYAADASTFPPRGVNGGDDAMPTLSKKQLKDGRIIDLPAFNQEVCKEGEKMHFLSCGGGGYGNPINRDPATVAKTVNSGQLSIETAKSIYKVVLTDIDENGLRHVDYEETKKLRMVAD